MQLDLLAEADLDKMFPLLSDPEPTGTLPHAHHRPATLRDASQAARSVFLARQGQADGTGGSRTAYAIRLVAESAIGPTGALVGASALMLPADSALVAAA